MIRHLRAAALTLFLITTIASLACQTADDQNATATAGVNGGDSARASDPALVADTATPETIGDARTPVADGEKQVLRRGSSSSATTSSMPAVTTPTPTIAPASTAQSRPTATPAPAATSVPETGPWLTALQAIDVAIKTQPGTVKSEIGHVARRAGETSVGDTRNTVPSPGAGYSPNWSVTILDGDQPYFCVVSGDTADCSTGFGAPSGDIAVAEIGGDSTAVFATWQDNADWTKLLGRDNISILLQLEIRPQTGGVETLAWNANVSVNGATEEPYGGNFSWTLAAGETDYITY